jgi:HD superfamily phosphodiesterase
VTSQEGSVGVLAKELRGAMGQHSCNCAKGSSFRPTPAPKAQRRRKCVDGFAELRQRQRRCKRKAAHHMLRSTVDRRDYSLAPVRWSKQRVGSGTCFVSQIERSGGRANSRARQRVWSHSCRVAQITWTITRDNDCDGDT